MPTGPRERNGFSLVEVLVVVAIATMVVLVVGNFGNNIAGLNTLVSLELGSKSDVSQTLQVMTEEIQSAETSAAGAYPIDSASTSSFAFYSDINKDGIAEYVRYFYASSTIYKEVIDATGTPAAYPTSSEIIYDVIDNILIPSSTPLFSYYGASYTGTQSPLAQPFDLAAIRLVNIAFEVQTNPSSTAHAAPPQYFSQLIDIRNLDSN